MGEGRILKRPDAVALARFLDVQRDQYATGVTVAERD